MMAAMIGGSTTKTLRVKEFRTSGTFTVPTGVKTVSLFLVAGGGGSNANAGNPGNIVELNYDVSGKASCAVVIGAGGPIAGDGGNSSFDGTVIAQGGRGASVYSDPAYTIGKNGFGGCGTTTSVAQNGAQPGVQPLENTGASSGKAASTPGGSGYCRVEWEE